MGSDHSYGPIVLTAAQSIQISVVRVKIIDPPMVAQNGGYLRSDASSLHYGEYRTLNGRRPVIPVSASRSGGRADFPFSQFLAQGGDGSVGMPEVPIPGLTFAEVGVHDRPG